MVLAYRQMLHLPTLGSTERLKESQMTLSEWIIMVVVGIVMCFFAYTSGFYLNEMLNAPHGATLFILMASVANSLVFGYTICEMIKSVKGRMRG